MIRKPYPLVPTLNLPGVKALVVGHAEPAGALTSALADEGERLLAFIEDGATTRDLRFADPG